MHRQGASLVCRRCGRSLIPGMQRPGAARAADFQYRWPDKVDCMPLRDNFTPREAELIISSAMKNKGLKRKDAERFLERDRSSKRNPLMDSQWVRNLHRVCEAMRVGKGEPIGLFVSVFWIRLYGVLVDLRKRYRSDADYHAYAVEQGKSNAFSAASAAVFEAAQAVHSSLTDDELVYATFLRHVEAHVYQDSFEYEVERGNPAKGQPAALRTKQLISPLRRHVDVDEAHRIVDAISKKAGHDGTRVAVNFAHKVGPHVERLADAMKALDVERAKDQAASTARRPKIERSWLTRR